MFDSLKINLFCELSLVPLVFVLFYFDFGCFIGKRGATVSFLYSEETLPAFPFRLIDHRSVEGLLEEIRLEGLLCSFK